MTPSTQKLIADQPDIAAAVDTALAVFSALNDGVSGAVAQFDRDAAAALMLETDPRLRGLLDGAVCQRSRAALVASEAARTAVTSLVAALSQLAADVARLSEPTA
jgi:hypothetical protein